MPPPNNSILATLNLILKNPKKYYLINLLIPIWVLGANKNSNVKSLFNLIGLYAEFQNPRTTSIKFNPKNSKYSLSLLIDQDHIITQGQPLLGGQWSLVRNK